MRSLQLFSAALLGLYQVIAAVPSAGLPVSPRAPQPGQSMSSRKSQSKPLFEQNGYTCIAQQLYDTTAETAWAFEVEVDPAKYYVATVELDNPKELLGQVEARAVSGLQSEQWQLDVTTAVGPRAVLAVHPRGLSKIQIIAHLYALQNSGVIALFEGSRPPVVAVSWQSPLQQGPGRKTPNGAGMLPPAWTNHWMTAEQWDCWRAGEEVCFDPANAQARPRSTAITPIKMVDRRPPASPPLDVFTARRPTRITPV